MDRIIEKRKGLKLKHVLWGAGAAILLLLLYQIFLASHDSVFRAERDKLTISAVENGQFNDYITIIGQVEPITTIYLDAEEGGRVKERLIEEGSMVKAGDVILKLENRQLYQTILTSETDLAEKENYLRQTRITFETELISSRRNILENEYRLIRKKRNFEQYEKLYNEELISKEDYLQSKEDYNYEVKLLEINKQKAKNDSLIQVTSMKTLETDLQKMRQMLGLVRERLDNLNVKAPVEGQLGMLDAEVGQSIAQGQRIGMIHVLTSFKVKAKIDEHYIDRIRRDLTASFERNGTGYRMIVRKVYPEVRDGQFEIDLLFDGENPENIRAGQTYHIKLELGQSESATLLARGGFFQSTGGQWVFVLNENGNEAVKRPIRIGKQNPQYYEVLEGLQAGEQVITSSYELFGNNDKIVFK